MKILSSDQDFTAGEMEVSQMLPKTTGGRKLFAVAACKMHSMHLIPGVQVNLKFSAYSTSKSTDPLETSPG